MPFQKEVLKNDDVYKSQVLLDSKIGRIREMEIVGTEHGKNKKGRKVMFKSGETAQSGREKSAVSKEEDRARTQHNFNSSKDIS